MARRKFQRSRFSPDRGWIVGQSRQSLAQAGGAGTDTAMWIEVFDFTDVDPDALVGTITQDKSDWFVRRCILDVFCSVSFANATANDTARLYQLGMGIMPDADSLNIPNQDPQVLSPIGYNNWARLFQTWVKPVYGAAVIPYTAGGDVSTEVGTPTAHSVTAPFWGPSGWHADFEVSNAGLRNEQSCGFHLSLTDGSSFNYDWDQGDVLFICLNYRILLQKRRT